MAKHFIVNDNIIPSGTTYSLGTSSYRYQSLYLNNTIDFNGTFSLNDNGTSRLSIGSSGNIGVNIIPSSDTSLHIKGSGNDSSAYSLKIENSTSNNFLSVRNDGAIAITDGYFGVGGADPAYAIAAISKSTGVFRGINSGFSDIFNVNNDGGIIANHSSNYLSIGTIVTNNRFFVAGWQSGTNPIFSVANYGGTLVAIVVDYLCNVGIGTISPSTKLHIYATQSGAFRLVDTTEGSGKVLTSDVNGVATWVTASSIGNGVTASGTTNYISKFTGTNTLGNSIMYEVSNSIAIGNTSSVPFYLSSIFETDIYNSYFEIKNPSTAIKFYKSSIGFGNWPYTSNPNVSPFDSTQLIFKTAYGTSGFEVVNFGGSSTFLRFENSSGVSMFSSIYSNGGFAFDTPSEFVVRSQGTFNGFQIDTSNMGSGVIKVGIGALGTASSLNATLHTKGAGNNLASYTAIFQNSLNSQSLVVRDDGSVNSMGGGSISTNTSFGLSSLISNTTGYDSISIGNASLTTNTIGYQNVSIGVSAMAANINGAQNVAIGLSALQLGTASTSNVAVGWASLLNNIANGNTSIGHRSLYNNTSGSDNTSVGATSLFNNTNGWGHTVLGTNAGFTNNGQTLNVFLGYSAGFYETGSSKLFIDNATRTDESDGRLKALIYGIFASDPLNQYLNFNANVNIGTTYSVSQLKYVDGNQGVGKILISDASGNATWSGNVGLQTAATSSYTLDVNGIINATSYSVGATAGTSGTFSTGDSRIVTVINGIITSIV